jgi:hypothetical protein
LQLRKLCVQTVDFLALLHILRYFLISLHGEGEGGGGGVEEVLPAGGAGADHPADATCFSIRCRILPVVLINPHVPPDESKNEDQTEAKVIVDEILKFNCRVSLKKRNYRGKS